MPVLLLLKVFVTLSGLVGSADGFFVSPTVSSLSRVVNIQQHPLLHQQIVPAGAGDRRRRRRQAVPPNNNNLRVARMQLQSSSEDSEGSKSTVTVAKTETKELGLLTFDLDDTLYPIAPIVEDANGTFSFFGTFVVLVCFVLLDLPIDGSFFQKILLTFLLFYGFFFFGILDDKLSPTKYILLMFLAAALLTTLIYVLCGCDARWNICVVFVYQLNLIILFDLTSCVRRRHGTVRI